MHIKCGMGSINRHAPSRTVPKTWKTVHSDLPFKMVKITELKVCALQTRPYRLYVKHRLLTTEWTKSISCRWERPISYLIRRMLIDISLSLDISITASAVGHQAEADGPVRPGEERGPAPHWAVDGGQPLQRHSGGVEPRVTGHYQPVPHSSYTHTRSRFIFDSSKPFFLIICNVDFPVWVAVCADDGENVRAVWPACQSGQVCGQETLGHRWSSKCLNSMRAAMCLLKLSSFSVCVFELV